jgi:hypothetical protein
MYQKQKKYFWGEERSRRVRLTISPPPVGRLPRKCGTLNISQPYRSPLPVLRVALVFILKIFVNIFICMKCSFHLIQLLLLLSELLMFTLFVFPFSVAQISPLSSFGSTQLESRARCLGFILSRRLSALCFIRDMH